VKVHWRVGNRKPSVRGTTVHLAVGTLHHEVRETDSTGVARFPRVPAGLAAATVPGAYGGGGSAHVEAGRHAEITLYMTPRGEVLEAVEGEVVDAEDAPVPGAWILAPTLGPAMVLAVTDDRGRFRIAPLQKDTVLQARAAGFAPSREVAAEGGRVRLELASGGGALVGRVVDATKRPVAGARVRLERKTRVRPQTSTNEGGVFFLEGIAMSRRSRRSPARSGGPTITRPRSCSARECARARPRFGSSGSPPGPTTPSSGRPGCPRWSWPRSRSSRGPRRRAT